MFRYTDTHAHLSMLDARGINAMERMTELLSLGFGAVLDIGTTAKDLIPRMARFSGLRNVRFSAGIWPDKEVIAAPEASVESLECTINTAPRKSLVAIGECGLDRHWNKTEDDSDIPGEIELFERQAELALRLNLPIIVHSREAAPETIEAIARFPSLRGVIHCFSYGVEEAKDFLDLGFYISFAGTVTYKNAEDLRSAARFVPPDRILLETDSPYLAPMPMRGKPAEPGMIEHSYRVVADARGISEGDLVQIVADNSENLFNIESINT